MKIANLFLVILISCNCSNRPSDLELESSAPKQRSPVNSKVAIEKDFTYELISAPENSFGYRIFSDQKLLIHQSTIPGLPGNKGFATKTSAKKVAELVITKLRKGEMPPTVSSHELKKLHVIE